MKITIVVDGDTITVSDDAGNARELKSIIVTGGDFENQGFYLFGWGSAADAGWALFNGFRWAHSSDYQEAPFYRRVWNHVLRWIATHVGANINEVSPAELLERWTAEDEDKQEKKDDNTYH